jgi:hypothetical protein
LTPRWTPLKPHSGQAAFAWHPARIKLNPSGRRSGKTEILKRKAALKLAQRKPWAVKIALAAPTYGQAKDIFWDDLKALIPEHWIASVRESDMQITTRWGASVRVFGFDRPRRIEGVPWDFIGIDELADCPPRCFARHVRPALATLGRRGECDLIGVPDENGRNQAEYEELYEVGLDWPHGDPDICSFHWTSSDIIEASEVEAMRREMDPLEFEQELGGQFVRSGGKALPTFDRMVHVDERAGEFWPELPLDWSLDFGVTPAAALLCQTYRGVVRVLREVVVDTDGSVPAQVEAFRRALATAGWAPRRIRIFGDAAGANRHSNIGVSDYDILRQYMRGEPVEWCVLDGNPLVKDSLNAVRCRCSSAAGEVRLLVAPQARRLIEDCRTAPWPDRRQLAPYHCLAALRYYCYAQFGERRAIAGVGALRLPTLGG